MLEDRALPDGSRALLVDCPTLASKIGLLDVLCWIDAADPLVIQTAHAALRRVGAVPGAVALLHRTVRDALRYTPEAGEIFRPAAAVLTDGIGDCDDAAGTLGALLRVIGVPVRWGVLGAGAELHVCPLAALAGRWHWLEPTVPGARLGEHPYAAAARTGYTRAELR